MQHAIQFETIIESGIIRVPEQFIKKIPKSVKVTLTPVSSSNIIVGARSKAGTLSSDDFSALKIDTQGWQFSREEANERC